MINLGASSMLNIAFNSVTDGLTSGTKNATSALTGFVRNGIGPAAAAVGVFATVELVRAVNAAQRFEDNLVRLSKVAGGDWGNVIARNIRNLSSEMPIASQALFDVAESAVRLGVRGTENINSFVRTMGMVGTVTDMSAQDAAENFARLAAVMDIPIKQIENLAATANELSDTMATSFSEVVRTSGEIAPVLIQMGILPEQIVAFAAAQNEVNVSVQRGAQRLRSFSQQLQETNRAANIAPALGLTVEAFRDMLAEDPTDMIIRVAEAMREGGASSRQLQESFDSAASLGVQALSQNLDGLRVALNRAEYEMSEAGSLARQFSEFMGSASSRTQELENRMEQLRSEIGENLLPLRTGVSGFFSDLVKGLLDARRAIDSYLRLQERLPNAILNDLIRVEAEIEGIDLEGVGFPHSITPSGILTNLWVRNFRPRRIASSLEQSGLIEAIESVANEMDNADGQLDRFFGTFNMVVPRMRREGKSFDEITETVLGFAEAIEVGTESWIKNRPELFSGNETETVKRLSGMNLEFAKAVLAERFGVALSDVDDNVARMLLSLRQSEIAFHDGDRAAREFELTLQNVPKSMRAIVLSAEENMKIQEMLRDSTNEYDSILEELTQRQRSLTETEDDAFQNRLDGIKFLMPWQRQMLQMAYDHTKAKEEEARVEREYESIIDDLNNRINSLNTTERQRLKTKVAALGLGDKEIEQAKDLFDELEKLEDIRAKEDQLRRMRERLDVTSLENRFRMLDQTISGVADNVIDLFSILNDENRKFGRAMQETIRQISRDFARMFLRMQMMRTLEGTSWFQNFVGLGASVTTGNNGVTSGMIPSASDVASATSASSAATTMAVNVNYTINSLDPRGVTDILNQQAPVIAANVAKQFNRSSYLREQSNA